MSGRRRVARRRAATLVAWLVACATALCLAPAGASAVLTIQDFAVTPSTTAAGAHPDVAIEIQFCDPGSMPFAPCSFPVERAREVLLTLPPGLTLAPGAATTCTGAQFTADACPAASQVGTLALIAAYGAGPTVQETTGTIYQLDPGNQSPARLGFRLDPAPPSVEPTLFTAPVDLSTEGDDRLTIAFSDLATQVTGQSNVTPYQVNFDLDGTTAGNPRLTNPTACIPAASTVLADSFETPDAVVGASSSYTPVACDQVPFAPTAGVALQTARTGTPSGITIQIDRPPSGGPIATSTIRGMDATLPPGMALSISALNGIGACGVTEFNPAGEAAPNCPPSSRIGSATLVTGLLGSLTGDVYLGAPATGPPFTVLVSFDRPGGTIKGAGTLAVDPGTGRVSIGFGGLPQLDIASVSMSLTPGDGALLSTPDTCGVQTVQASVMPWSAAPGFPAASAATPVAQFATSYDGAGAGCPAAPPFAPSFAAGLSGTAAGAPSALTVSLGLPDRDAPLAASVVELPPGLVATLAGLTPCTAAQAAALACPASSLIGTATLTLGHGATPLPVAGSVFLTEPGPGSPGGMLVTAAVGAGPVSLGTLAVPGALYYRPGTLGLTLVLGAPTPSLQGVPLPLRSMSIAIDRTGLLHNPTSCGQLPFRATTIAVGGRLSTASVPFAVSGCTSLPFTPQIEFALGTAGRPILPGVATPAGDDAGPAPSVRLGVAQPAGQSRLATLRTVLSAKLRTAEDLGERACTVTRADAGDCPAAARLGTATLQTAAVPAPLTAPVWLVDLPGQRLPGLYVPLRASGLATAAITGTLQTIGKRRRGQRLMLTLTGVPDVPLDSLVLDLDGGDRALLRVDRALCEHWPPGFNSRATSQAFMTAREGGRAILQDCPPTLRARASRRRSNRPVLQANVRRVGPPGARSVTLTVPRRWLRLRNRPRAIAVTARSAGRDVLERVRVRPRTGRVVVDTDPVEGPLRIDIRLGRGSLVTTAALRRRQRAGRTTHIRVRTVLRDGEGGVFRPSQRLSFP